MLIIVLHTSLVLVTVRATKKAKINSDREIIVAFSRNSGVFCGILNVLPKLKVKIKKPVM